MSANKTIMIVDDDPDDRMIFEEALADASPGSVCLSAPGGEEALQLLRERTGNPPDYIFLDLNMPRVSGKQCLAEIRKMDYLRNVPVIIYSTSSLTDDVRETQQLGANHFLSKPNHFSALRDALANILTNGFAQLN
ncbi:MAG: response regulator [Chitinophagales bacterium]